MLQDPKSEPGFTVDEPARTIRFVRRLAASADDAFEAWTDPAQVAMWWDATGERLASCEIDLRPGGRFCFVTRHHPDKPFAGVYREVERPDRLVFDANGAVGTITFRPRDGGVVMTVEIVSPSAEHLAQFVRMGIHIGTSRTLDNLVAFLGLEVPLEGAPIAQRMRFDS